MEHIKVFAPHALDAAERVIDISLANNFMESLDGVETLRLLIHAARDQYRQAYPELGVKVVDPCAESVNEFTKGQQNWIEDVVRTARETAETILRRRATYKAVSTAQSLHQQADLKMIDRNAVLENILKSAP